MKATIAILLALTTLAGCAAEGREPFAAAQPEPEAPSQEIASDSVKSDRRMTFEVYIAPGTSAEVETGALRAGAAWEAATIGEVRFVFHNQSEKFSCEPGNISIGSLGEADFNQEDHEEGDVATHRLVKDCHYILANHTWSTSQDFQDAFKRLKVHPWVGVMGHELGHAIGLPHASPTDRSIMVPAVNLARVSFPTCFDVMILGVKQDRVLRCHEAPDPQ